MRWRFWRRPVQARPGARRLLVPFSGGRLDAEVLAAALRIVRAEDAVFVPAYLIVVPLSHTMDAPLTSEVAMALPLLEAVEVAALDERVAVDARFERGRTLRDALRRLWDAEPFDRILIPVTPDDRHGFSEREVAWILTHAPAETLALRPASRGIIANGRLPVAV